MQPATMTERDPGYLAAPSHWPAAWAQLYPPILERAVFVGATMLLTGIGLAVLGDPLAQWWAIALPLLLLIGPALRPIRARAVLQAAVVGGRAAALTGRLVPASHGADGWFEPEFGDPSVPLSFAASRRTGARRVGQPALLVWHRRFAAVVFPGGRVMYLDSRPRGVRADPDALMVTDVVGRLAGS